MSTITQTTVANLALGHLGDHRIDDFDETDPAASDVRDHWEIARLEALAAYGWSFASTIAVLNRSNTVPVAEYQYAYDKPANWIRTNQVSDNPRFGRDYIFRKWFDRSGQIQTDAEVVYIDYVYDHTTVGAWPSWFVDYMSASLAFRINPRITTSKSHGESLMNIKKMALGSARARDAQQQPIQHPPRGKWYAAMRGAYR